MSRVAQVRLGGCLFEAIVDSRRKLTITKNGELVARGKWKGARIVDCSAVLVADDADGAATAELYSALDSALERAPARSGKRTRSSATSKIEPAEKNARIDDDSSDFDAIDFGGPRPDQEEPDLKVTIRHRSDDLEWTVEENGILREACKGLPATTTASVRTENCPKIERWSHSLVSEVGASAVEEAATRDLQLVESIGEKLYEATPQLFKDVYWKLAKSGGPLTIQLVCDEPFVPWEFIRPVMSPYLRHPPLILNHAIARISPKYNGFPRRRIPAGDICIVAPKYGKRNGPYRGLPRAQQEVAQIVKSFSARHIPPTRRDVVRFLENNTKADVRVVHFAGHGDFGHGSSDAAKIFLNNRGDSLMALEIGRDEIRLGFDCRTFVMLNSCYGATQTSVPISPGGWPGAFLRQGFGGFLGPLKSVGDEAAMRFATAFYSESLGGNVTIAMALLNARRALAGKFGDVLIYLFHGDVMSRFE